MTEDTAAPEVPTPVESEPRSLYKYSTWVHVGDGAAGCPDVDTAKDTSACSNAEHFHTWCRLPNPLQQKAIREHALAAKARRSRQLRQAGSDANEILESSLEDLLAQEDAKESLVQELLANDTTRDLLVATREARDRDDPAEVGEDDEPAKLFAHVEDDQARLARILTMPEDERNTDELEELRKHLTAYTEALQEELAGIQEPKRASWETMDELELVDQVRRNRIEERGVAEFMHYYNVHEWLSCALTGRNGKPVYSNMALLEEAPDEVIHALAAAFADLERTAQSAEGN